MSPFSIRPTLRPRLAAAALFLLTVAGAVFATGAPAHAHEDLIGSIPEDGAVLTVSPEEVVLEFSAEVMDVGTAVAVVNEAEEPWPVGEPVHDGARVIVPLEPGMPDGTYEIRWRVVAGDGHPMGVTIAADGSPIGQVLSFTVAAGVPAATETPEPAETDVPSELVAPEPSASAAPTAAADGGDGTRTVFIVVGGAAVVAAITTGAIVFMGRRRGQQGDAGQTPGTR